MSSLVVKTHRPWQFFVAIVVLSMFLASLTWMLLDRGHWSLIYSRLGENREWQHLWEVNQGLQEERVALLERVVMLERTTSVDRQTAALLQNEIRSLQEKIYTLKEELEFYQGIMDSTRDAKGLNIQGIYIEPLGGKQAFVLKLVLTNVTKNNSLAEGQMVITIVGRENEQARELKLEEIAMDEAINLGYKLRSFKRFESKLQLPDGFTADRVVIELKPKSKNQVMIREVFDWTARPAA